MPIYLETDRLNLTVLQSNNADRVLDYYIRNKDFLEEWDAHRPIGFYTPEYQEQMLEKEYKGYLDGTILKLWISLKKDPSEVIGFVVFNNIVRGCFLSCHLGYKLDKGHINKGYVTEAVKKGIDVIFNEYKLHRIEANIMPKNRRSMRVVEKLGFYNEGIARKYLKINGIWEDHTHFALFNDSV